MRYHRAATRRFPAQRPNPPAAQVHMGLRQDDPHRARAWMRRRKRDQVARSSTTDLEHPSVGHLGWVQSERPCDRRQLPRCRLGVRVRVVRRFVIGGAHVIDRIPPIPGLCARHSHRLTVVGRTGKRLMLANASCGQHLRTLCVSSDDSERPSSAAASARGGHGHCPLFTHSAGGGALKVGEANDVASVSAGAMAVAVAPIFIAVGSTDIVGTTGETYAVPVAESPDPPATLRGLGASGWVTTSPTATMIAPPPSAADIRVSRCVRIDYLHQQPKHSHGIGRWLPAEIQKPHKSTPSNSESLLRRKTPVFNRSAHR